MYFLFFHIYCNILSIDIQKDLPLPLHSWSLCLWICLAKRVMLSSHDRQLSWSQHWHCRRSKPWGWSVKGISINHTRPAHLCPRFIGHMPNSLVQNIHWCWTLQPPPIGCRGLILAHSVNSPITGAPHANIPLGIEPTLNTASGGPFQRQSCEHVWLCGRKKQTFQRTTNPVKYVKVN